MIYNITSLIYLFNDELKTKLEKDGLYAVSRRLLLALWDGGRVSSRLLPPEGGIT
jgi:hypothetical protein